jgi:hypothetical protein
VVFSRLVRRKGSRAGSFRSSISTRPSSKLLGDNREILCHGLHRQAGTIGEGIAESVSIVFDAESPRETRLRVQVNEVDGRATAAQ